MRSRRLVAVVAAAATAIAVALGAIGLLQQEEQPSAPEAPLTTNVTQHSAQLNGRGPLLPGGAPGVAWYQLADSGSGLDKPAALRCRRRSGRLGPCKVGGLRPGTKYYWRECAKAARAKARCSARVRRFTTVPADDAVLPCDRTIVAGEAVSDFVDRLGEGRTGCLTAGTYDVGNLDNFAPGQRLIARSDPRGNRERVTLRGTLRLKQPGVELHDLFVVGVLNPENDKVISVNHCDGCVIDHLDITTAPRYQDFQGILNNTPSRDIRITSNRIHHVGNDGGHDHGIYCKAPVPGGIIEGNWLYRNAAYGIIFYTNCDGVDFRYNVVANNGVLSDCNPDQPPNTRCPVTDRHGLGVAISGQPDQGLGATDLAVVRRSVIASSARYGQALVHCYQAGHGNAVRDVILDWGWADRWPDGSDCPASVAHSRVAPRIAAGFRNEGADDYRLRPNSRAGRVLGSFADRTPGPRL